MTVSGALVDSKLYNLVSLETVGNIVGLILGTWDGLSVDVGAGVLKTFVVGVDGF